MVAPRAVCSRMSRRARRAAALPRRWPRDQPAMVLEPGREAAQPTSHSNPTKLAVTVVSSLRWRGPRRWRRLWWADDARAHLCFTADLKVGLGPIGRRRNRRIGDS